MLQNNCPCTLIDYTLRWQYQVLLNCLNQCIIDIWYIRVYYIDSNIKRYEELRKLTTCQSKECRFTQKRVRDMIVTYSVTNLSLKEPFMSKYCIGRYKAQEMWDIRLKKCEIKLLMLFYQHRYKTQEMWDKVADAFVPTLKFVSDWFVANKLLQ